MAANETTTSGESVRPGTNLQHVTPRDTIKGWNSKRKANNQVISSLVPFVQLIGLFDDEEYRKMFELASSERVSVVFDDGTSKSAAYNEKYAIGENYYNDIKRQIEKRSFNLYLVSSADHGLDVKPIEGLMMAEKVTQAQDPSGGIGITDLQVDYGNTNVWGSRKFDLRMTINDPKILDEKFEYSKLATFGSAFLIIYGWANPEIIPGYDAAMSPPKLEEDPNAPGRQRMVVPLRNLGNGGHWSSGHVYINKYEFGFNEMGKMELNIQLLDNTTMGMSSTTISSIAKKFKLFLDTGALDRHISNASGESFTLRQALQKRQLELNKQFRDREGSDTPMTHDELTSQWGQAIEALENRYSIEGLQLSAELAAPEQDEFSYPTETEVRERTEESRRAQVGYPFHNTLNTYKQIFATVFDPDGDPGTGAHSQQIWNLADDEARTTTSGPTKQIIDYEKTPVYYFLGALMDSVSLCMASSQLGIGSNKVPSFFYRDISSDSKLSTVFQSKLKSVNRASGMEERIQEAIIRLKERFLPPSPTYRRAPAMARFGHGVARRVEPVQHRDTLDSVGSWTVSGVRPVYNGAQTTNKTRILNTLKPAPPNVGRMVGAPMRGHKQHIDTATPENTQLLADVGLEPYVASNAAAGMENTLVCFIPDWKQEVQFDTEGNEKISSGSPDGFDPLNPSEYRAAEWGGRFFMIYESNDGNSKEIWTYELWRRSDTANWNLLQKTWHNMYVEYLADYFESIIRKRINELTRLGMPIESIYLEPLDLDFLTGKVFNFTHAGRESGTTIGYDLKPWDEVAGKYPGNDMNIGVEETKLRQDIAKYDNIKKLNKEIIYGKTTAVANFDPAFTGVYDQAAMEQYIKNLGGLKGASASLVRKVNNIKIEIENLTGGRYERNGEGEIVTRDVMNDFGIQNSGNIIMMRFRNFDKIVAAGETGEEDEDDYEIEVTEFHEESRRRTRRSRTIFGRLTGQDRDGGELVVYRYEPEIEYEYKVRAPEVTEKWVLWKQFQVPTNNYQNEFNIKTRQWMDEPNKAEKWKEQNSFMYERHVVSKIENDQELVREKLNTIAQYQEELNEIYDDFQQSQFAIDNAQIKITDMETKFENFTKFFNENEEVELSLYDDTSAFDYPVPYDMGRDEDMILTTKVAQQAYRRFQKVWRGAMDVRNYGPPQHGKPYQLPTNNYTFRFRMSNRYHQIVGQPLRVMDPEVFKSASEDPAQLLTEDLSFGTELDVAASAIISENMEYPEVHIGRITRKSYQNWSLFGNPGIPNEFGNNEWGFKYGPPTTKELADGSRVLDGNGGNYVRTYQDFLNLFNLGYNPDWEGALKITGKWPTPEMTSTEMQKVANDDDSLNMDDIKNNDQAMLLTEAAGSMPVYTLIDSLGSIIVDDGNGWYRPSGWYLDFAGDPVFLYPSRQTACEINDTDDYKDGVRPGAVMKMGGLGAEGGTRDRQVSGIGGNARMPGEGRELGLGQQLTELRSFVWQRVKDTVSGAWEGVKTIASADAEIGEGWADRVKKSMLLAEQRRAINKLNDGEAEDYLGNKGDDVAWGSRIGINDHCMNLTLDMKRSMVLNRGSTQNLTWYLGTDMPSGGGGGSRYHVGPLPDAGDHHGPAYEEIYWAILKKEGGELYILQEDYEDFKKGDPATYRDGIDENGVGRGGIVAPMHLVDYPPYSNPKYPYGTGWYKEPSSQRHGPWTFPESWNREVVGFEKSKSWVDWADFLITLDGNGYMTKIDNSNYTSCMVQPDGSITDGLEMNEGFVDFIIRNVWAPLPRMRRCGVREGHSPIEIHLNDGGEEGNPRLGHRIEDVTYEDLFGYRDYTGDGVESELDPAHFGNIENFKIDNVKNIPIRRELIDNLINKNNTSMSVTQFFGEVLRPGSIGINNAGNQQIGVRQDEDGVYEVFSVSSINWKEMGKKYDWLFNDSIGIEDEEKKRFPEDIIMLDFKASDSLIENLNMNSMYDPLVARAFKNAAVNFTGDSDALINFISYKEIAPELKTYFEENFPEEEELNKAITIDEGSGEVTLNKEIFFKENETTQTVVTAVTKYLQDNPARMNSMKAMLQAVNSGQTTSADAVTKHQDYATQTIANHMKKATVTIHGTTNLSPFQAIIIKGIMPNLQGLYWITSTRESITPQGFQTILEGALLAESVGVNARGEGDANIAQERSDDVAIASSNESSAASVDEAAGDEDK